MLVWFRIFECAIASYLTTRIDSVSPTFISAERAKIVNGAVVQKSMTRTCEQICTTCHLTTGIDTKGWEIDT